MLPCNKIVGDARAGFHAHHPQRVVELALDADRLVGVALVDVHFGPGTVQGLNRRAEQSCDNVPKYRTEGRGPADAAGRVYRIFKALWRRT